MKKWIIRSWLAGLMIVIPVFAFSQSSSPETIVNYFVWSTDANTKAPPPRENISNPQLNDGIFLWLNLSRNPGEQIFFKWFRYTSFGLEPEEAEISSSHEIVRMSSGLFLWSGIREVQKRGKYVVKVVYGNMEPVMCGESLPCEYTITVR